MLKLIGWSSVQFKAEVMSLYAINVMDDYVCLVFVVAVVQLKVILKMYFKSGLIFSS